MKSAMVFALLAVILLTGTISPAVLAQIPNLSTNVIINEVELNPPGSDSRSTSAASSNVNEFVELYNPTDSVIDVSGWQLVPSKSWKSYTIPSGTLIQPNDHAVFMASSFWFNDSSEFITLKDPSGVILDQTPLLDDTADDLSSWQRVYDGLDTDNSSDWVLKPATGLSSNGSYIAEDIDSELTISLEIDKEQYNFNEKVNISGSVSELAHSQVYSSTTFMPEQVIIFINGPGSYSDKITVYPDTNLQFSTSLTLYSVFGYSEGLYSITANYSTSTTSTNFTLGEVEDESVIAATASELLISTDKSQYNPGEWVIVTASTNNMIDYVGLKYTISDSRGNPVSSGTIFPNTDNQFTTKYFIPVTTNAFGVYQVFANYQFTTQFSQTGDSQAALTSFTVSEDEKSDELISVLTDNELYVPGDIVHITGRSNSIHVDTFDIQIEQTGIQNAYTANEAAIRADPINLLQTVRLDGESKFELSFQIPSVDESIGTYQITAGENFGKGYGYFKVVSNIETYVAVEETPLGLQTDRSTYALNDKLKISGFINKYELSEADSITFQQVQITFKDPVGHTLKHSVHTSSSTDKYEEQLFMFTSIPDQVGSFRNQVTLDSVTFSPGIYTLKAVYHNIHDSVQFEILSDEAITAASITDELDQDLITINVDQELYEVGDTVVITGKVLPRELVSTRSEVSKYDEQGKDDHYRPKVGTHVDYTNYGLNFVKVNIPYPITLYADPQSEYRTTTADGSLPTGSCGPSGGVECQGTGYGEGAIVKYREILKKLEPFESSVYPDENGNFKVEYELRGGIFEAGTYIVEASYFTAKTDTTIRVVDNRYELGSEAKITVGTDKDEYKPGENVSITGVIEGVYYFDPIGIIVNPPDQGSVNCLKMYCGEGNVIKKVKIGGYYSDSPNLFGTNYQLPDGDFALGEYTVIADTKFGNAESTFVVTHNPILKSTAAPVEEQVKPSKIIEKVNRISNTSIPISVKENSGEKNDLIPRVMQGSLFTSARGEEPNVNLQVSTGNGSCIIGQSSDCVISESTRSLGGIYKILKIGGIDYKVRYSGPDVRLEKFSIVPVESNTPLEILKWDVNVIKDEQPSRFYYKISYTPLE